MRHLAWAPVMVDWHLAGRRKNEVSLTAVPRTSRMISNFLFRRRMPEVQAPYSTIRPFENFQRLLDQWVVLEIVLAESNRARDPGAQRHIGSGALGAALGAGHWWWRRCRDDGRPRVRALRL